MTNGADSRGNFHDENGQFVSISTLFERERTEHIKDHETERTVARETAQRLEREVEQTAQRLERIVEETAFRLETGVQTALAAVAETARVHAEAHQREHISHERIHAVEKIQVDKAEVSMNKRLEGMNEFRQALTDQANRAVPREYYDSRHEDLRQRVADGDRANEEKIVMLDKRAASADAVEAYKKILFGSLTAAGIALAIAVFNLLTG